MTAASGTPARSCSASRPTASTPTASSSPPTTCRRSRVEEAQRVVDAHLVGDIAQIPPMVSAIRVDGRRLHELAREGIEVDRQPRPVTIDRFDVTATDDPAVLGHRRRLLGRHVRADAGRRPRPPARRRRPPAQPAADRGRAVHAGRGGAARRVRAAGPDRGRAGDAARWSSTRTTAALIANGRVLAAPDGAGPWAMVGPDDRLLGVYEPFRDGQAKPSVVLA